MMLLWNNYSLVKLGNSSCLLMSNCTVKKRMSISPNCKGFGHQSETTQSSFRLNLLRWHGSKRGSQRTTLTSRINLWKRDFNLEQLDEIWPKSQRLPIDSIRSGYKKLIIYSLCKERIGTERRVSTAVQRPIPAVNARKKNGWNKIWTAFTRWNEIWGRRMK